MEAFGDTSRDDDGSRSLCSDHQAAAPSWAFLHKAIITIIMGSLMSAAGVLLFLVRTHGEGDSSRSVASACLSIGLMFVAVGLVWIPILKEKHRRKRLSQGLDFHRLLSRVSAAIMSTSVQVEPVPERSHGAMGRCRCSFWFAVAHDILGVLIMMVGVFGGLVVHDLFIYAGAIIIFLSLIWWVFWYTGNIDVPPEELEDDVGLIKAKRNGGLSRAVRRVSNGIRNSFRRKGRPSGEGPSGGRISTIFGTDVALSSTLNRTNSSSSKELVREPLSI